MQTHKYEEIAYAISRLRKIRESFAAQIAHTKSDITNIVTTLEDAPDKDLKDLKNQATTLLQAIELIEGHQPCQRTKQRPTL